MEVGIKLETKLVGSIQGDFYIPSYQRGYRWGKDEVTRLLDDIYSNGNNNYCLQPVVVKRDGERFELIDGQQRLTTLFILLQYIKKEFKPRIDLKYSLTYETRLNSATFLQNIDPALANDNIDYFHIAQAYQTIDEWFRKQDDDVVAADDVYGYLVKHVKIIWYEVGEEEDAIGLFTRLNIGKIPLTSAELVKAMFLSRDNSKTMTREKQEEIALQWDNIEKELHNSSFWGFLSDKDYQTRIDLILDLIANKPSNSKDKYFTFFYFDGLRGDLDAIWKKIQHTFLILKDWYEDHNLYHQIGYLIASKDPNWTLQSIFSASVGKTKTNFASLLDDAIADTIKLKNGNYADLSYEKPNDYARISRLLLLYNVETVRNIAGKSQRFPFDQFKSTKGGAWSLEHIHAQQSEGMQKQEQWKKWLELHIPSVESLQIDSAELIARMKDAIAKEKLERTEFEDIQDAVVAVLSAEGNVEFLHSIANLALLRTSDNAALNNSTFDVKRNEIIKMDKAGQYIPFCTRMVFLKYYTPSADNQLHFWGQADRVAYVNDINRVLGKYLGDNLILIEKEAE
ncbi:MAG: DUF262 domain-containing protein [Ruminococcaceae bacterium]|nr:DUF262 domain-containing protein [Oscillospiraceae bacterium]